MNSIDPPGSAEMSHIASSRCGKRGAPSEVGNQGICTGLRSNFASGTVSNFGEPTAQYIPFIIIELYGAIYMYI